MSARLPRPAAAARSLAALASFTLLQACATGVSYIAPGQPAQPIAIDSGLLPTAELAYRVYPLDTLQIEVYPANGRASLLDYGSQVRIEAGFTGQRYVIAPGDALSVQINSDSDISAQVVVRPDGMIALARLAREVEAAGRTASDLGTAIAEQYSAIMRTPQVTVDVLTSSAEQIKQISGSYQVGLDGQVIIPGLGGFAAVGKTSRALAGQIAAAARRRFRNPVQVSASPQQLTGRETDSRVDPDGRFYFRGAVKVSPEGTIFLEPGGQLSVAGLSLPDVRRAATALLQPLYANPISVNATVGESTNLSVFVAGEVRQPGRYPYSQAMTLLKVITLSGWLTEVGDLTHVLLLHPTTPRHYDVYQSNVREVLDHGAIGQDLPVAPQDIVVVPISLIGQVDQAIDQFIRKVLPFNTAVSYSYISNPTGNTTGTTSRVTQ